MVNESLTAPGDSAGMAGTARDAEFRLALSYAGASDRPALAALFALDAALGQVLRTTSEPLVGQMRLTWWHDALTSLDARPAPAEPVLQALVAAVVPRGIGGSDLASLVEGWEALLDLTSPDAVALEHYAAARGGRLVALAGRVLGTGSASLEAAGAGWALADLARHVRDADTARRARDLAVVHLAAATRRRWPSALRALGALTHLARLDLAAPADRPTPAGTPHRVARLAWHRLTGR